MAANPLIVFRKQLEKELVGKGLTPAQAYLEAYKLANTSEILAEMRKQTNALQGIAKFLSTMATTKRT